MAEKYLLTKSSEDTSALFGAFDANIRLVEAAFDVRVSNRRGGSEGEGDEIVISGDAEGCATAHRTLEYLGRMTGAGETLWGSAICSYNAGLVVVLFADLDDLLAVVVAAGLAGSVRQSGCATVFALSQARQGKLPVGAASLISSGLRNSSLGYRHR